jgi:DNA-binding Lrp family transcriptional regulator
MPRRRPRGGPPRELDLEIIAHLQADTRKPFTAIADELGLSESTVRKRVDRLEALGILRFAAFADPLRLGFQYWSLVEVNVELSALDRTALAVARHPEVFFVGITTGERNLFVAGVFRSNADLLDFLTTRLSKLPGVTATATSNVLRIIKRRGPIFGRTPARDRGRPAGTVHLRGRGDDGVSPLDRRIIVALQSDGRKPFAQVAAQLGVAESTVHNRVGRLKDLGILDFETFADPLRLGFQHWTLLGLGVDPTRVAHVGERLAEFPELFFVGLTTGKSDVFAAGVFRSNEELLSFLTARVARLPSVRTVSTTNVLRLVKRQTVYPLTVDGDEAGGRKELPA